MSKKLNITENELRNMFINQNKTRKEIANYYGVKEMVVKYQLNKYKIQKPKKLIGKIISNFQKERYQNKKYKRYNNGVVETFATECPEGFVPGILESTKKKQSAALKGKKHNKEWVRKVAEAQRGRKLSEERKKQISEYMSKNHPLKGTHRPDNVKEALVRANLKMEESKKNEFFDVNFWKEHFVEDNNVLDRRSAREYFGVDFSIIKKQISRLGLEVVNKKYDYNSSLMEKELVEHIKTIAPDVIRGYRLNITNPKEYDDNSIWYELDLFIPSKNIAIEFNGCYYHAYPRKNKNYHKNKRLECKKQGIKLLQVWECDWLEKKELVKKHLEDYIANDEILLRDDLGCSKNDGIIVLSLDYYTEDFAQDCEYEIIDPQMFFVTKRFRRTLNKEDARYRCYNSGFVRITI